MVCSVEKRSWPAGTGVCVVKTHFWRTSARSASVAAPSGPPPNCALHQRQRQQRRVAFVHVVHIHPVAQRVGHAHAAHAQHDLLLQAVVGVAAIEVIGQAAIPSRIALQIRVQQVDRHHVPITAHQVIAPAAHRHNAVFH